MIEVSEVIAKVRERLNDNEVGNYEILDSVLVENINQVLLKICLEFKLNKTITRAKTNANNEINTNKTASLEAITQAKTNANNEISTNKTQAITNINEAKENAQAQINTNKQEVLNNITQQKQEATSEIIEAKKTAFNELLETLKPKFSGLFVGTYYIRNVIYIQGGWDQKIKDLSDYTLEKSKKGE